MQQFRWQHIAVVFATMLFIMSPADAKTQKLQPLISVETSGIGVGATYALKHGNDLHVQGTFAGTTSSGNGTYLVTGANGANPVLLNLALSEHIGVGDVSFTFDHHLKPSKPFFVSGGFLFNFLHADADTVPTASTLVFAGNQYSAAALGTLSIHARWHTLDPYLGVGWSQKNVDGSQHGPMFELGAYYIGQPHIAFSTQGVVNANPAIFGPYLESLRGTLVNQLGGLSIYPVLRASFPVGHKSHE